MGALDLGAIEAAWQDSPALISNVIPDLVAEVRRLRMVVESLEGFPFTEQRRWTER